MAVPYGRLCILLEGTAAMMAQWADIRNLYLEPLLRATEKQGHGSVELALIVFYTRDAYSECVLDRSGWTQNIEEVRQWLDAVQFYGGGHCEVALAEAFADLLYLHSFPPPQGGSPGHCQALICCTSQPHRWPVLLPFPSAAKEGKLAYHHDHRELFTLLPSYNIMLSCISNAKVYVYYAYLLLPKAAADHKEMTARTFQLTKGLAAFINPSWLLANEVLKAARAEFHKLRRQALAARQAPAVGPARPPTHPGTGTSPADALTQQSPAISGKPATPAAQPLGRQAALPPIPQPGGILPSAAATGASLSPAMLVPAAGGGYGVPVAAGSPVPPRPGGGGMGGPYGAAGAALASPSLPGSMLPATPLVATPGTPSSVGTPSSSNMSMVPVGGGAQRMPDARVWRGRVLLSARHYPTNPLAPNSLALMAEVEIVVPPSAATAPWPAELVVRSIIPHDDFIKWSNTAMKAKQLATERTLLTVLSRGDAGELLERLVSNMSVVLVDAGVVQLAFLFKTPTKASCLVLRSLRQPGASLAAAGGGGGGGVPLGPGSGDLGPGQAGTMQFGGQRPPSM